MTPDQMRERLEHKLIAMRPDMHKAETFYTGTQPLGFMDPDQMETLGNRVHPLSVNLCALAVDSLCQVTGTPQGFRSAPGETVDAELLDVWQRNGMDEQAEQAQLDSVLYGRAFFLAWADVQGRPVITAESPLQLVVERDPVTRRITAALKRWVDVEGYTRSLLLTADTVTEYASMSAANPDLLYSTTQVFTMTGDAKQVRQDPNPLGVVPVVALVNRPRLMHQDGRSEVADLMGLQTAISKLGSDMMVGADYAAAPRRWMTGLEPSGTYTGNSLTQEQQEAASAKIKEKWEKARASRFIAATSELARFGSFDQAELTNFETAIRLLAGQVASLASLPSWFVDNAAVNPVSADAIRAGMTRLTMKAKQRQRWWSGAYEDLMRLSVLIRDGVADPRLDDLETLWLDPEPSTIAQTADATSKLIGAGVIDRRAALENLDYSPLEIDRQLNTPMETGAL